MKKLMPFSFATVLLLFATYAGASAPAPQTGAVEELDLSALLSLDVVVAATGKASTVEDAPAIVSVMNYKDIQAAGYRTVGEALRTIPGLSVIDDHVDTHIGIRGFFASIDSSTDILKLMINGQAVAFRPNSGNFFGYDLIPIQAVKRIEIIRGPASSLYGANAFLGVVNVVTFTGNELIDQKTVPRAFALGVAGQGSAIMNPEANNIGNITGSAIAAAASGDFDLLLGVTYAKADRSGLKLPGSLETDLPHPTPSWDGKREALLEKVSTDDLSVEGSFYGLGAWNLNDWGELLLDVNGQFRSKSGEYISDTTMSHRTKINFTNGYFRLKYLSPGRDDGFYWDLALTYAQSQVGEDDQIADPKRTDRVNTRDFSGRALSAKMELNYGFGPNRVITLGFDFDEDDENLLTLSVKKDGKDPVTQDGYGKRIFANHGIYAQLIWQIYDELTMTTGVRFDHNDAVGCNPDDWDCFGESEYGINPIVDRNLVEGLADPTIGGKYQMSSRMAFVYNPKAIPPLYTKLAYGSSYKAPTPYQLYHMRVTTVGSEGKADLLPQTADTIELLLGYKASQKLRVELGGFYLLNKNLVTSFKSENRNRVESLNANGKSAGLEASVDYKNQGIVLKANLSYLLLTEVQSQKPAGVGDGTWETDARSKAVPTERYPMLMANLFASYTLEDWYLKFGGNVHLVMDRNASFVNNTSYNIADLTDTYKIPPYVLLRANISTTGLYLADALEETVFSLMFFGSATGDYMEPGVGGVEIPGLGPSVYLKLTQYF